MVQHIMRIVAITLLILACLFLPFFPGRYDALAVTLSTMAQLVGVVGLLLVPIGALWLVYEWRRSAANEAQRPTKDYGYHFAIASLIASSIVAAPIAVVALSDVGFSFGLVVLALLAFVVARLFRKMKRLKNRESRTFNPVPLYLVCIPIAVFLCWLMLIPRAIEWSRNYAIERSAQMINEIEQYRRSYGHYPTTLAALHSDYKPSVIGIKQYYYAPNGDTYNLYFEQPSPRFGTREIVIYNKQDEHLLPGHDSDILRWTPDQLRTRSGHYAVHDTSTPHWKYLWFD